MVQTRMVALFAAALVAAGCGSPSAGGPDDAGAGALCGNGTVEAEERCDDGNTHSGDGCSETCVVETVLPDGGSGVCGNGEREPGEGCDDGNTEGGDGCGATCAVESGWTCNGAGQCQAALCGDGIVAGAEECEDGDAPPTSGDGCSASCRLESGYKCPTPGAACETTTCGDGVAEGTEQCDDGNSDLGDGCSPMCEREPDCENGVCTPVCGDGLILPNDTTEACDDGNTRSKDGCSATCTIEPGFMCERISPEPPSALDLTIVYRDFKGHDLAGGHPDFENANGAEQGIVGESLDAEGKPQYAKSSGSSTTHGEAAFKQWYRDTAGVNKTLVSTLQLDRQSDGSYVFDSPNFFPLDDFGWVKSGEEPLRSGSGGQHNFSFTSEVRYWFEYKGTEVLTFRGDDDVWVFINGRRVIDLGGVHSAQSASVTLADVAGDIGLQPGGIYEVAVFQAERHTSASSYRLTLNNFLAARSECTPLSACGDGVVQAPWEQCDDGVNDGAYEGCAPGCVLGPRCGDGVVQSNEGEMCDDGNTEDGDTCPATCRVKIN